MLLYSYLNNRNQFVSFENNYSSLKPLSCGVFQGSILGPFLFLVYINDLPNALSNKPRLYADDTCLTVTSSSIDHLQLLYNSELKCAKTWMDLNKLMLNETK